MKKEYFLADKFTHMYHTFKSFIQLILYKNNEIKNTYHANIYCAISYYIALTKIRLFYEFYIFSCVLYKRRYK